MGNPRPLCRRRFADRGRRASDPARPALRVRHVARHRQSQQDDGQACRLRSTAGAIGRAGCGRRRSRSTISCAGRCWSSGLFTRPAALVATMFLTVACFERWRVGRWFWNKLGMEYTLLWAIAALHVLVSGPGPLLARSRARDRCVLSISGVAGISVASTASDCCNARKASSSCRVQLRGAKVTTRPGEDAEVSVGVQGMHERRRPKFNASPSGTSLPPSPWLPSLRCTRRHSPPISTTASRIALRGSALQRHLSPSRPPPRPYAAPSPARLRPSIAMSARISAAAAAYAPQPQPYRQRRRLRRRLRAAAGVRGRLESRGWQDFHDPQVMGNVVHIRARRPNGRLFDLTLDRCSGEVLAGRGGDRRAADGPAAGDWRYRDDRATRLLTSVARQRALLTVAPLRAL